MAGTFPYLFERDTTKTMNEPGLGRSRGLASFSWLNSAVGRKRVCVFGSTPMVLAPRNGRLVGGKRPVYKLPSLCDYMTLVGPRSLPSSSNGHGPWPPGFSKGTMKKAHHNATSSLACPRFGHFGLRRVAYFQRSAAEKGLAGKYTDPTYFTKIPFGAHSHWLQPWRAYLETVPAQQFLDGIGLNLQFHEADPELVLQMLARNGVRSGRLEIGWGSLDYNDPAKIQGADQPAPDPAPVRSGGSGPQSF